ncbi:Usually multiple acids move in and out Transporters 12 [Hibiscus trionum]|nr:Usually multiple acids move in and out Transporters 12 [Hibiscus trionum]
MGSLGKFKPYFAAIFLQVGLAGMDILSKVALNQGMSNYALVVYRHAIATVVMAPFAAIIEKKVRPKMTISIFIKIMLLGLLEPVIDQNLYYVGMKYTTATFAAAMYNILPAITFLMAWIFRLEKVNFRSIRSHAKVIGTLATVAGAMVMTLMKGPVLELFWTKASINNHEAAAKNGTNFHDTLKGGLMISAGCFSYACFVILQAVTLKTYPAELSLTAWICLMGTLEGSVAALIMEKGNAAIWALKWDTKLLTAAYSGIVCSGLAYYIQGVVMKDRGPVFVTAFSPLCMVIVAIMSSFILAEQMFLGRVIGAIIIIGGLYFVLWGKGKEYKSQQQVEAAKLDIGTNSEDGSFDHQAIMIDTVDGECKHKTSTAENSSRGAKSVEKRDSIVV